MARSLHSGRGRKVAVHPVTTVARKELVTIRLNSHTGKFSATMDEVTYESDRLLELRSLLQSVATRRDEPTNYSLDFGTVIDILPTVKEKGPK